MHLTTPTINLLLIGVQYNIYLLSVVVLTSLCVIDVFFVMRACTNVQTKGMSVDIAFGLEVSDKLLYVVLNSSLVVYNGNLS